MVGSDLCKEKGTERGAVNMIGFISDLVISLIPVFVLYVFDKLFDLKARLMRRFKTIKSYRNTIAAAGLLSITVVVISASIAGLNGNFILFAIMFLTLYLLPAPSPEKW